MKLLTETLLIIAGGLLLFLFLATGVKASQRIVGGEPATKGQYPFTAALVNAHVSEARAGHRCGASLIAPQWAITAGHCVHSRRYNSTFPANSLHVMTGSIDLNNPDPEGERLGIEQIIVHETYQDTGYPDLALIKLSTPSSAETIALTPLSDSAESPGTLLTIAGWGRQGETRPKAEGLLYAQVPVTSDTYCRSRYGASLPMDHVICAGWVQGGKDACVGDSGGPLFTGSAGSFQLVGVVSFGVGCARANWPGGYARVSGNIDWIKSYVETTPPIDPPPPPLPPVTYKVEKFYGYTWRTRMSVRPGHTGFVTYRTGTIKARLTTRSRYADHSLMLQQWIAGRGWLGITGSATQGRSESTVKRNAPPGRYRWVVRNATRVSGSWLLRTARPQ